MHVCMRVKQGMYIYNETQVFTSVKSIVPCLYFLSLSEISFCTESYSLQIIDDMFPTL